jgi:hypothetical protein
MYLTLLTLHSLLRWVVIGLGFWAVLRAYAGASSKRAWAPADDSSGRWFTMSLDVQFLLGLVLYAGLSPITSQAFGDMGEAMRNPVVRFWTVEHAALMLLGIVLAHVGRARSRRPVSDAARHRTCAVFFALSLLAVLAAIPWPFMNVGRPLLRLFS